MSRPGNPRAGWPATAALSYEDDLVPSGFGVVVQTAFEAVQTRDAQDRGGDL